MHMGEVLIAVGMTLGLLAFAIGCLTLSVWLDPQREPRREASLVPAAESRIEPAPDTPRPSAHPAALPRPDREAA